MSKIFEGLNLGVICYGGEESGKSYTYFINFERKKNNYFFLEYLVNYKTLDYFFNSFLNYES